MNGMDDDYADAAVNLIKNSSLIVLLTCNFITYSAKMAKKTLEKLLLF
jgi:hypothetical protein